MAGGELLDSGRSRVHCPVFGVKIDELQHDTRRFLFVVLQPGVEVHLLGVRSPPLAVHRHVVLVRILGLLIASVEYALDVAKSLRLVVHT